MAGQTWGPLNGPGVFTARLARGLVERGDEVTVAVPAERFAPTRAIDGGVSLAGIPAIELRPLYPDVRVTPAPGRAVQRLLEEIRPDVVHIQDHFPLSRSVARTASSMNIPLIASNHFVPENIVPHVPLISRSKIGQKTLERFLWWMVARVFGKAKVATSPTETAAALLRKHLDGVPVHAISCGVDHSRFAVGEDRSKDVRSRLELDPSDVVFIYVGRLDYEKRVEVLLEAMARTTESRLRLIIAGRGREATNLKRLAERRGISQRVLFVGFVAEEDLPALLTAADFFAMPGDVELQSIATLEAMAAGLPVLAANAGALPELVEDGVNGALFRANDPDDAAAEMEKLSAAIGVHYGAMSAESLRRTRAHAIELTVEAYSELYASVVGATGGSHAVGRDSPRKAPA